VVSAHKGHIEGSRIDLSREQLKWVVNRFMYKLDKTETSVLSKGLV